MGPPGNFLSATDLRQGLRTIQEIRKAVGDRGIPVIHSTPKMLHENERHAARLAESAIGEADSVGLDELCPRGLVAVLVHRDSLWR